MQIEKNIRSCGRIKVSNIKSRRNWDSKLFKILQYVSCNR